MGGASEEAHKVNSTGHEGLESPSGDSDFGLQVHAVETSPLAPRHMGAHPAP